MNIYLFASETQSAEGLAAFGVNWQTLLFQAITFLLVVLVLKKYVLGKIYEIIDARQAEIDDGLDKAEQAKKNLANTQEQIDALFEDARTQAELIVSSAKAESATMVQAAEEKAAKKAEQIIHDAQSKLATDVTKARHELQTEAARLISEVAAAVLQEKLDDKKDSAIIAKELENYRAK